MTYFTIVKNQEAKILCGYGVDTEKALFAIDLQRCLSLHLNIITQLFCNT